MVKRIAVAAVLVLAPLTVSSAAMTSAPSAIEPTSGVVDLSYDSPGATHLPDGSWTVRLRTSPTQGAGFCRGTYIDRRIVARGNGTAVHFATKYFCTEPVSYTVTTGVNNLYEESPRGPLISHPGGQVTRSGVSQNPYVEGFSPPCKNNLNSGWRPYDDSTVRGKKHTGVGRAVTVGCRV